MDIECEKCGRRLIFDDPGRTPHAGDVACPECGHTVHIENNADKLHRDESNWEDFVSISKTERDTDDFRIEDNMDVNKQESDFNWANLKINDEPVTHIGGIPKMFEDEGAEDDIILIKERDAPETEGHDTVPRLARSKGHEYAQDSSETLSVDMSVLASGVRRAEGHGDGYVSSYRDPVRIYPTGGRPHGGIISRAAYTLLILIVFTVIIGASYIILANTGVIPRETADSIERYVRSLIPGSVTGSAAKEIVITAHSGRWLDTRNGPMYVIRGTVTNEAVRPVNYIKIRSEFISDGQTVYDNVVYAGNTFTENELRVSPLNDTLLKLKKKSGDIDYYNAEKLSGLNSNVQPGESIPFFAVYPAPVRMLGLKYNLEVVGYE